MSPIEINLPELGGRLNSQRRLIVCCDGTENDSISTNNPLTNVARLSRSLQTGVDEDGFVQIVHYQTGVATGTDWLANIYDAAFGRGEYEVFSLKAILGSGRRLIIVC